MQVLQKTVLLHDNGTPQSANVLQDFLNKFKWDVWGHAPYLFDHLPGDFHVIGSTKNDLATIRYSNDDEVKNETLSLIIFNQIRRNLFDTKIEKLVPYNDKYRLKN